MFICEKHFASGDILVTSKRSRIKIGALPIKNLPIKSHESTSNPARRTIFKHPCPISSPIAKTYGSIDDLYTDFDSHPISNWRAHRIDETRLHLTYFKDPDVHACPYMSLLIRHQSSAFELSLAIQGVYASGYSHLLTLEFSLQKLLRDLTKLDACEGYVDPNVEDNLWNIRHITTKEGGELVEKSRSDKFIAKILQI